MDIKSLPSPWRLDLRIASFKNATFHCESNSRESGRRIVEHEFPKKELPYAEDMGHRAQLFIIRGYCITYVRDVEGEGLELFRRDYRVARDLLRRALDSEGAGVLQLPTQKGEWVVCSQYRLTEEERFGGFCIFDMQFMEYGIDPSIAVPTQATAASLVQQAEATRAQLITRLNNPNPLPAPPAGAAS